LTYESGQGVYGLPSVPSTYTDSFGNTYNSQGQLVQTGGINGESYTIDPTTGNITGETAESSGGGFFSSLLSNPIVDAIGIGALTGGLGDLAGLGTLGDAAADTAATSGLSTAADTAAAAAPTATTSSALDSLNLVPSNQALTNAAIKTGLGLATGQSPTQALESGALGLASGVVGSNVANAVSPTVSDITSGNTGLTQGISQGIGSTAGNLVTGATPTNAIISGVGTGIASGLGPSGSNIVSAPVAQAAGTAASTLLNGGNLSTAVQNGLIGAGGSVVGSALGNAINGSSPSVNTTGLYTPTDTTSYPNYTASQPQTNTTGIGTGNYAPNTSSGTDLTNATPTGTMSSSGLTSSSFAPTNLASFGIDPTTGGFTNAALTSAGTPGAATASLTNVPGSAPASSGSIASLPTNSQGVPVVTITGTGSSESGTGGTDSSTQVNYTEPESTVSNVDVPQPSTDASTQTDVAAPTDTNGVSISLPTSNTSSPSLTSADVSNIVQQQLAANPGLTESEVQSQIQSALAANPSMTADQVNQIVAGNISGLTGQISNLQSGQSSNQAAINNLTGTVSSDQAQTQNQLANMSSQEQSDVAELTAQGTSLSDAINQVSQQSQTGLSNLTNTVNANQAATQSALSGLSAQDQANYSSLTAAQQQQAQALAAQGTSLSDAINQVSQQSQTGLSNLTNTVSADQAATTTALGNISSSLTQAQNQANATKAQQALNSSTSLSPYKAQTVKGSQVNLIGDNTLSTSSLAPLENQNVNPYQVQYNAKAGGHIAHFSEGGSDTPDDTFQIPDSSANLIPVSHSPLVWHGNPKDTQNFTSYLAAPHLGAIHLAAHADGGTIQEEHHPEFYSQGGLNSIGQSNTYVTGKGDGTSDSIPAMLANGEFVIPADVVSSLGNGDNSSGASVLDQFLQVIRHHKRDAAPDQLPPDSKGPLTYLAEAQHKVKKS
jgi:uncharacterized protein YoaH (UPF0181 family)